MDDLAKVWYFHHRLSFQNHWQPHSRFQYSSKEEIFLLIFNIITPTKQGL